MKRKLLTCVLAATSILAANVTSASKETGFNVPNVTVYDSADLTADILTSRSENHDIVIEKVIGLCLDNQGNGRILNAENPDYDYISYRETAGVIMEGDVVLTLLVYNPDNGYCDDVVNRLDFIIDSLGTSAS